MSPTLSVSTSSPLKITETAHLSPRDELSPLPPLLPDYIPPAESRETAVSLDTAIVRISEVLPTWAANWSTHASSSTITVWIEPKAGVADPVEIQALLKNIQDAVYPVPARLIFPRSLCSPEGKQLPYSYSYIQHRKNATTSPAKPVSHRKIDQEGLEEEIATTLPAPTRFSGARFYRIALPNGPADFIVLNVYSPPEPDVERALNTWREEFERRHGISVFIALRESTHGLTRKLSELVDAEGIIRPSKAIEIQKYMEGMFGTPPSEEIKPRELKRSRDDMTHIKFIALDPEGVRDREDLIYAERLPSGHIRVLVAYIDITDIVPRNSDRDRYAQRVGHTVYGRDRNFPTLGSEIAHGPANFALGETRPAWVVELLLHGETGENLHRHWPVVKRANVRAHTYQTPEEFNVTLLDTPFGNETRETLLAEAAGLLRRQRINKNRIVRLDGDTVANDVVAELMIASKGTIGEFLHKCGADAIWRVLATPSIAKKSSFAEEIGAVLKEKLQPDEFDDPRRFAELVRALEKKGTRQARSLARQLLDVFLIKTTFSTENEGHFAVGQDYYLEFKPRDASGIRNQQQADAIFGESEATKPEILKEEARSRDNRRAGEYERQSNLRFQQMLVRRLSQHENYYEVVVTEVVGNKVMIKIPGFKRTGFMLADTTSEGEQRSYMPGECFIARLDGFHLASDIFRFSPIFIPCHAEFDTPPQVIRGISTEEPLAEVYFSDSRDVWDES